MSEPKIEPLTKLGNYLLGHQNVIDACWTAKVIEEARQQHTVHLEHVQQFLNEMYATMIDPCEQPEMKVSEMCTLLLKTATEQRQQINDLSEHAPSSPALSLKYFHPPFELREPQSDNEACNIVDSAGNPVAMMYWPTHPVEETLAAEQETYALGRAFAGRVPSSPAAPTPRDKCPQCGSEDRDMPHVGGFQGSLGWVNSDQGYDVCVHSWHNSPAAPTPHMNVVEFAKTGPGRDILTGQQSMFYSRQETCPFGSLAGSCSVPICRSLRRFRDSTR